MSRRQVKTELFQILSFSILVIPSAVAEIILNRDFTFSDVAFSEGTMRGERMSLSLSILFRSVSFGVGIVVVRYPFLEDDYFAASSSVESIEVIDAFRRLLIVP